MPSTAAIFFIFFLIDPTLFSDARDVGGAGIDHRPISNPPTFFFPQYLKDETVLLEALTR